MTALSIANHGAVAILTLDLQGEPVNKLNGQVKSEFEAALERLKSDAAVKALIIISGKSDNFIAGADIEEFTRLSTREEFERLSREGQEMLQRLDDFPKPVIAAINGACLGGGLELALACDWRIATDHPKTQLGLPEVQLGLLPGAGGCQRLPRLIGLSAALGIIMPGKTEAGLKAFKLGIVDELVPKSILLETALQAAERLVGAGVPPARCRPGPAGRARRSDPRSQLVWTPVRVLEGPAGHPQEERRPLSRSARGPRRGQGGAGAGRAAGYRVEHQKFGELAATDVSRKLIEIFFATTALKKDDGLPEGVTAKARPVERIAVIGSGFMGAGIAGTAVSTAGIDVRVKDTELPGWARGSRPRPTF